MKITESPGDLGSAASSSRPPVLLIFTLTVTGILNNSLIVPALPDIARDLDVDSSAAGLLVAAGSLPGIVVAPIIGLLADRFGRRAVLVPCLLVYGIAGPLGALAPSYGVLLATRLVQGFGTAGLINLAVVLIGDHWTGNDRTRLIGQNSAVLTLGLAVSPGVGGVIADLVGWRGSFCVYSVALLTAAAVARTLPAGRPDTIVRIGAQFRGAMSAARNPTVVVAFVSAVVTFLLIFGLMLANFPVHLDEEFGVDASGRGLIIAVPALSACLVSFNLGRLRPWLGLRRMLLIGAGLFVASFTIIGLAPALGVVVVGVVFYGLGEGLSIPVAQDLVAEEAPDDQRGALVALWVGSARLGQTIGPLLVTGALQRTTTDVVFLIGAGVAAALCLGIAASPVGRGHRRPVHVEPPVAL